MASTKKRGPGPSHVLITPDHAGLIGANASIRSGRSSKARTEADTSSERHPSRGVRSLSSQASVQPSSLRRPLGRRGQRKVNTGIALLQYSAAELTIGMATLRKHLTRPC